MSQSVKDALADAATLRLYVETTYHRHACNLGVRFYVIRKALGDAGYYGFSETPELAFRGAFRAVPELRG